MYPHPSASSSNRRAQCGVSLLFALLTLVVMSLAAVALVRSVDTSAQLLGNLGFKQDATAASDQATRQAIDWLTTHKANLGANAPTNGYYASTQELAADGVTALPRLDATGQQLPANAGRQLVDWDGNSCAAAPSGSHGGCSVLSASAGTINGNAARYAVFRLCSKPGDPLADSSISCVQRPPSTKSCGGSKGSMSYGDMPLPCPGPATYYRIVVRVLGARNTASFTETVMHF